jgi:hypothetical protein
MHNRTSVVRKRGREGEREIKRERERKKREGERVSEASIREEMERRGGEG